MELISIASVVPQAGFETEQLIETLGERVSARLRETLRATGVEKRYSVFVNMDRVLLGATPQKADSAAQMGARAVKRCLAEAEITGAEVGLMVAVTNTQDELLPGLAYAIQARAELPRDLALVNNQGVGCSGLLKALEVVGWYLNSHPHAKALVVVAESQTPYMLKALRRKTYRHFYELRKDGNDPDELRDTLNLIQGFLFGDGAVALLLGTGDGFDIQPITHLSNHDPADLDILTMTHHEGSPQYKMGPGVPGKGTEYIATILEQLLAHPSSPICRADQAAYCLVHTGSKKILDRFCALQGVDPTSPKMEASYSVLRRFGNLSAASIGFMLAEGAHHHRGRGLIVGFGVGFSASAGLLRYHPAP